MEKTRLYKRLLILLSISLLSIIFTTEVSAQEINYCTQPGATATFNQISRPGYTNWVGTASNIKDNNTATDIGFNGTVPVFNTPSPRVGKFEGIVTFAETAPEITSVKMDNAYHIVSCGWAYKSKVYLYYGGGWNYIGGMEIGTGPCFPPNCSVPLSPDSGSMSGHWYNVEKVKVYIEGEFKDSPCFCAGGCKFTCRLKEIKAFGLPPTPAFVDIGLRVYNGTEKVSIAAEPQGTLTSPLRIAKDGDIYGIALVDAGDPNASGVRIKTSSGVKALRKY